VGRRIEGKREVRNWSDPPKVPRYWQVCNRGAGTSRWEPLLRFFALTVRGGWPRLNDRLCPFFSRKEWNRMLLFIGLDQHVLIITSSPFLPLWWSTEMQPLLQGALDCLISLFTSTNSVHLLPVGFLVEQSQSEIVSAHSNPIKSSHGARAAVAAHLNLSAGTYFTASVEYLIISKLYCIVLYLINFNYF